MPRSRAFRVFSTIGGILGLLVLIGVIVLYTTSFGKGLRDIASTGVVQAAIAKHQDKTYDSTNTDANLKSVYTAFKLYEQSEGQYPDSAKWMDEIAPRLVLNNLPLKEAEKKMVRPGVPEGSFGYALNDAASAKYHGDLPKGTILLFESKSTERNAHGDPKADGLPGGRAITIEGTPTSL